MVVYICGEGNGTPLQYSCLENPTDGGAWWAAVHGVAKSRTRLSDLTFTFHFHALEKEMATHSSVLAWRIPGTGEPGGLPSMGLHRVGHDWNDLAVAAAAAVYICQSQIDLDVPFSSTHKILWIFLTCHLSCCKIIFSYSSISLILVGRYVFFLSFFRYIFLLSFKYLLSGIVECIYKTLTGWMSS